MWKGSAAENCKIDTENDEKLKPINTIRMFEDMKSKSDNEVEERQKKKARRKQQVSRESRERKRRK